MQAQPHSLLEQATRIAYAQRMVICVFHYFLWYADRLWRIGGACTCQFCRSLGNRLAVAQTRLIAPTVVRFYLPIGFI